MIMSINTYVCPRGRSEDRVRKEDSRVIAGIVVRAGTGEPIAGARVLAQPTTPSRPTPGGAAAEAPSMPPAVTTDGQGIELDKFHTPNAIRFGPVDAPVNTLGIRRVMFAVDDIDAVVARMCAHGAELIGEMRYEDSYRLAYIRGPEGIIVGLAEQLG